MWPGFARDAIPSNAGDIAGLLNRGTQRLTEADFTGAIEDFSSVIELQANVPEGYFARYNRALAKSRLGEIKNAIDELLVVIKMKPDCEKTKALLTKLLS